MAKSKTQKKKQEGRPPNGHSPAEQNRSSFLTTGTNNEAGGRKAQPFPQETKKPSFFNFGTAFWTQCWGCLGTLLRGTGRRKAKPRRSACIQADAGSDAYDRDFCAQPAFPKSKMRFYEIERSP